MRKCCKQRPIRILKTKWRDLSKGTARKKARNRDECAFLCKCDAVRDNASAARHATGSSPHHADTSAKYEYLQADSPPDRPGIAQHRRTNFRNILTPLFPTHHVSKMRISMGLLSFFLLLSIASALKNPCHPNKSQQGKGVTCDVITLPASLCKSCRLRPYNPNGNFFDCANIYNLDTPQCEAALNSYVKLNPCDEKRKELMNNFASDANKKSLDYFVYSVCEECCDCVRMGTVEGQYAVRKMKKTLLKATRGNCPAHAFYDICKVWPNVKYLKRPNQKTPDLSKWPKMCPMAKQWRDSPSGQNWYNKETVKVSYNFRKFLWRFMSVAGCASQQLWNECVKLETAQNRL